MASEGRGGLFGDWIVRGVASVRKRARRARIGPGIMEAGLRAVPLFVDGIPLRRIYVAVGSMVDVAVQELGARLTEVEPLVDESPPGAPGPGLP